MGWVLLAGALGLGAMVWLLALVIGRDGGGVATLPAKPPEGQEVVARDTADGALSDDGVSYSEMSDLEFDRRVEPLAKRFLEARTVEEMLSMVREPERARPRMKHWHPDGTVSPPGLVEFDVLNEVVHRGNVHMTVVRTGDFQEQVISFVETADGLKVDWEAWVGWSEMPWADYKTARPVEPKVFRVVVKPSEYYNRDFSDEVKWKSFRIESPDGLESMYGYAEAGSELAARLKPPSDAEVQLLVLRLRFPESATSGDQVVIDAILAEGWVLESEGAP
jgi:hypothetical protein